MKFVKIIIIVSVIFMLFSGCIDTRPQVGKIGDQNIQNNTPTEKRFIIEDIGNYNYRIIVIDSGLYNRYVDTLTLGYLELDKYCDIRYTTSLTGEDGRAYAGSSTTALIVKTNNCTYKP